MKKSRRHSGGYWTSSPDDGGFSRRLRAVQSVSYLRGESIDASAGREPLFALNTSASAPNKRISRPFLRSSSARQSVGDIQDVEPGSPLAFEVESSVVFTPTTAQVLSQGIDPLPVLRDRSASSSSLESGKDEVVDLPSTVLQRMSMRPDAADELDKALKDLHLSNVHAISDYTIQQEIGKGAYGSVYRAKSKCQDKEVLIKFILKTRILADCWKRDRVWGNIPMELAALEHVRRVQYVQKHRPWASKEDSPPTHGHPNIIGMLDFFQDPTYWFLVMPAFGCVDLFDYIEARPRGLFARETRRVIGQIADAVEFLHAHHIVHRDIKDENIILDEHLNVKLIDFGSAALVKGNKVFTSFSGTLDYAAPEILASQNYKGPEQDIWALGIVTFVVLCGECPFKVAEEAEAGLVLDSKAHQTLMARTAANDEMDADGGADLSRAYDLISACLKKNPADRPTATQLLSHPFLSGSSS